MNQVFRTRTFLIGITLLATASGTAMQATQKPTELRDKKLADKYLKGGAHPLHVSIIQLIANPEKYENKPVRIHGFYREDGSDEDSCIYLSAEDSNYSMGKNGLWVHNNLKRHGVIDYNRKHVIIEGVFSTRTMGHMDANSGEIRDVWLFRVREQRYDD